MAIGMIQLFWNAYKRLEKEFLALSEVIHFDDNQKGVYSSKIGDLLVRAAIEIESLSKVLFDEEGGIKPGKRNLSFDSDCLSFLEDKWKIGQKTIFVSSSSFYFEDDKIKILTPLCKSSERGDNTSLWKQAYQAVKHDRVKNLQLGNIENLLNALGALFILNIYYRNASIENVNDKEASNIDWGLGSDIFTVKISPESGGVSSTKIYEPKADYDACIYLVKHTDKTAQAFIDLMQQQNNFMVERAQNDVIQYLLEEFSSGSLSPEDRGQVQSEADRKFNESYKAAFNTMLQQNGKQISSVISGLRFEAVLNKQQF